MTQQQNGRSVGGEAAASAENANAIGVGVGQGGWSREI